MGSRFATKITQFAGNFSAMTAACSEIRR